MKSLTGINASGDFLDSLQRLETEADFGHHLQAYLHGSGVSRYTYLALNPQVTNSRSFVFSNYNAKWREHYTKRDYVFADPVVQKSRQARLPFVFDEKTRTCFPSRQQDRIMREAQDFGYAAGLALPIHGMSGEVAMLVLADDQQGLPVSKLVKREIYELYLAALYFHNVMWDKLVGTNTDRGKYLTPRQTEVLGWLAAGKTMWETSVILGISETSVRYHISQAALRLGTFNITSTVAKAISLGFLRP